MNFPRYPSYRDSGVEWLGEVPDHWQVSRIGTLFREVSEEGKLDLPILSVSIHHGVSDSESDDDTMDRKVSRSEDRSKYKRVRVGDLVYNMMRAWQGGFGAVSTEGMVSPAYVVARPKSSLTARLAEQILRTPHAIQEMKRHSQGVVDFRLRLYWEEFKNIRIPVPPQNEQFAIMAAIDASTVEIDALIAEQVRLVELLKEKRQVVISLAVTKGLNPDSPMKPSGIEWLGDVPVDWEVGPIKRFVTVLDGRRIPLSVQERAVRKGLYSYYGASGVIDTIDDYIFDEDLVLVSEDGANLLNRSTPIAFVARGKYWVNNHAHILRPIDDNLAYWAERIETIDLTPWVTGSAQPKLTIEALRELRVAVPSSIAERHAIQEHILKADAAAMCLVREVERAIALLRERRTALITAAVTGKIDVRSLARREAA